MAIVWILVVWLVVALLLGICIGKIIKRMDR